MNKSDFDPYHKWLSIPRSEQPANYYRLLGVPRFESDADVIESAAQRQITHVRSFMLGQYAELSQSILNELAKARVTLLDSTAKENYDTWLIEQQQHLAVAPSPTDTVGDLMQSVPPAIPIIPVASRNTARPKNSRKQRTKLIPLIAGFAVAVPVITTIGWLLSAPNQSVVTGLPAREEPSRDTQAVEHQDGVQTSQPQSRSSFSQDSSKPLAGRTAERLNGEAIKFDQQPLLFHMPFDNSLLNLGQSSRQVEAKGDVQFVHDRFGRPSAAIQFGPRSSVEVLQDESLFPCKTGGPLTYSMWIRSPASIPQIVASKYGPYDERRSENNHFYLAVGSSMIAAWGTGETRGPGKSGFAIDIEDKAACCSEWSHFVVAFDPTESKGSVYCNGELLHEGKMVFNAKESSPVPLRFGRLPYDSQSNEITQMDDVRIFARELSADEVSALYRSEK